MSEYWGWDDEPALGATPMTKPTAEDAMRFEDDDPCIVDTSHLTRRKAATAEDERCRQCGKSVGEHGMNSDCGMFVGPASTVGAEAERAAVVAWLRAEAQFDRDYAEHYGITPITKLGLERALYYEQAAGMLERGDHHKGG